jgi:hypothetical protein
VVVVKLAIEARHIKFMLGDDNVAVVVKKPITVDVGCGARHRITWRSSFLLRGGIKLFPAQADQAVVEIGGNVYHVVATRKLRYATIVLADKVGRVTYGNVDDQGNVLPYVIKRYEWFRQLEKPELVADGYLVFQVEGGEAKLVNEEPDHIMLIVDHSVGSRVYEADIKIKPENLVVFKEVTSCKTQSVALTVALAPVNSSFTLCYNRVPYRREFDPYYRCYRVKTTIPPKQEFLADTPTPEHVSTEPDTII